MWQERAVNCIIYISLLALQGIANGSDELGNLLLLDRNEQRDDKEFIQVRLYKPTAKQASYKKDIRCKPCIGFLAAISQLSVRLYSGSFKEMWLNVGTNLMRSKLLIAWLITLQAAIRRGVLKHDKHSTNAVL